VNDPDELPEDWDDLPEIELNIRSEEVIAKPRKLRTVGLPAEPSAVEKLGAVVDPEESAVGVASTRLKCYGEVNYKTGELLMVFDKPPPKGGYVTADYMMLPDDAVTRLGDLVRDDNEKRAPSVFAGPFVQGETIRGDVSGIRPGKTK